MYTAAILAVYGALLSLVTAAPLNHKRDIVVVTKTDEVVVTVPVIQTVWLGPGETAPTAVATSSEQAGLPSAGITSLASPALPTITKAPEAATAPVASSPQNNVPVPAPAPAPAAASVPALVSSIVAPAAPSSPVANAQLSSVPAPSTFITSASAPAATSQASSTSNSAAPYAIDTITSGQAKAGTSYVGDLTYYATGLGACGVTSSYSDHIVAISEQIFDNYNVSLNPNDNPLCGQYVEITGVDGTVYPAKIVDRCVACDANSLDLSQGFFDIVTRNSAGQVGNGRVHNIHWQFASS